jgi:hypothetical protein
MNAICEPVDLTPTQYLAGFQVTVFEFGTVEEFAVDELFDIALASDPVHPCALGGAEDSLKHSILCHRCNGFGEPGFHATGNLHDELPEHSFAEDGHLGVDEW